MTKTITTKKILISPIGDIPLWVSEKIAKEVQSFFGFQTQINVLIDNIDFAFDKDRDQYSSSKILDLLDKKAPDDCVKVVAITEKDLFIPILTYVYGEARLNGRPCIVSIDRLVTGLELEVVSKGYKRIVKEAIHELGHTFNLRHCKDPICLMHYCRNLEDVDRKSNHYCRYCNILLSDNIKDLEK
ncbi:MAG: archaemetzincin family Zn-dependent metalloprotease [Desulfobacteraceae bacterium]|nr:archaemetzincin family Zn-dependent metalloprotease [Desulfobacteraceae bacterium]